MRARDRLDRHEADIVAVAAHGARRDCRGRRRAAWRSGAPVAIARCANAGAITHPLMPKAITSSSSRPWRAQPSRPKRALRRRALLRQPPVQPPPGAAAAVVAAAGAASSARALGGASVTTVKSRSRIVGVQPSGSLIAEMCSESLKSRPVRSAVSEPRDVVGRNLHLDRVPHDVERAAASSGRAPPRG